jgi:hypothetical protein
LQKKGGETKHSAAEINVMADAVLQPPMHPMKDVECFAAKAASRPAPRRSSI